MSGSLWNGVGDRVSDLGSMIDESTSRGNPSLIFCFLADLDVGEADLIFVAEVGG